MEQQWVLLSREECEHQVRQLQRAIRYCIEAKSSVEVPLDAEPTESYSGASGYACQTMKSILCSIESSMMLS